MARRDRRERVNPDNRFLSTQVEWEPGMAELQGVVVAAEPAKTIVASNDSPDIPFRFSVNPYRGCTHACAYCFARPGHEYFGLGAGTDFDTRIFAKTNAPELLRRKLAKGWPAGEPLVFSGVTDCYQPAERSLRLTRGCLEACRDYGVGVALITKSTLVLRDLDVLGEIARRAHVTVTLSIPFADAATARALEPYAPPPEARFRTLRALADAGLRAGISLGPVIPGLNDHQIPANLAKAKEHGAAYAFYVLLRLPGSVAEVFLERLRRELPGVAGKVEHHIRATRGGDLYRSGYGQRMGGSGEMAAVIDRLFRLHARKLGLDADEGRSYAARMVPEAAPAGGDRDPKGSGAAAPPGPGAEQLSLF